MPTLAEIFRAIKAAVQNALGGKAQPPAPSKTKLNGRRGYGDSDLPTPKP